MLKAASDPSLRLKRTFGYPEGYWKYTGELTCKLFVLVIAVEADATWALLEGVDHDGAGILIDPRITPSPTKAAKPTIVWTNDLRE